MAALTVSRGDPSRLFRGGELVIDLGCGDGRWLDGIAPRYKDAVGIDMGAAPSDGRGSGPPGWRFIQGDLDTGLPFDDGVADAIHANQVIEHIREPVAFLAEAHRVLRPNGLLVVTTPNVRSVRHIARLAVLGRGPMTSAHEPGSTTMWDDGHLHYFTPGDLAGIARAAGFASPRLSGLVAPTGRFGAIRPVLGRLARLAPIREFVSGNILLIARR